LTKLFTDRKIHREGEEEVFINKTRSGAVEWTTPKGRVGKEFFGKNTPHPHGLGNGQQAKDA